VAKALQESSITIHPSKVHVFNEIYMQTIMFEYKWNCRHEVKTCSKPFQLLHCFFHYMLVYYDHTLESIHIRVLCQKYLCIHMNTHELRWPGPTIVMEGASSSFAVQMFYICDALRIDILVYKYFSIICLISHPKTFLIVIDPMTSTISRVDFHQCQGSAYSNKI
jgi:hypothetical protein